MQAFKLKRHEAIEVRRKRLGDVTQHELASAAGLHPVYGAAILRGSIKSGRGLDKLDNALKEIEKRGVAA